MDERSTEIILRHLKGIMIELEKDLINSTMHEKFEQMLREDTKIEREIDH